MCVCVLSYLTFLRRPRSWSGRSLAIFFFIFPSELQTPAPDGPRDRTDKRLLTVYFFFPKSALRNNNNIIIFYCTRASNIRLSLAFFPFKTIFYGLSRLKKREIYITVYRLPQSCTVCARVCVWFNMIKCGTIFVFQ